ncbi:MAG: hydrogenase nickel incorporation protein HypB [candidate division Zixibacteria bacterium]|nr:hydrogenase nickel incorporation protein HypB [candidate division Zixibacteria bacterium]MBU1470852.1 hydrogenase nickel incorporation protein HypB [candidate division Zixibacteria bacterium]MBU2625728.1 hydrogenase nickel incorporation protein HypB [candidate division Zixibacteria bacterium]
MTNQKQVSMNQKVLSENDRIAGQNRDKLIRQGVLTLNLVSSPGSGKTSLLENTLKTISDSLQLGVIVGDVQTENDARRLEASGGKIVHPIITGGACHLDAKMVSEAMQKIDIDDLDVLFLENVGNLVCPSSYDLGEDMKVVLISTTEGDDKPLKYPAMFRRSSVLIINKTDLLGMSDFRLDAARKNALQINGELTILELSCRTGEGMEQWYDWLKAEAAAKRSDPSSNFGG